MNVSYKDVVNAPNIGQNQKQMAFYAQNDLQKQPQRIY
jgi:hypothetical protein